MTIVYIIYMMTAATALFTTLVMICFRLRTPSTWAWFLGLFGFLVVIFKTVLITRLTLNGDSKYWTDFTTFHAVGEHVLAGRNPYFYDFWRLHPFLNPPTILPLLAGLALLPFRASCWTWTVLNLILAALLIPLAWLVLRRQTRLDQEQWNLDPRMLGVLATTLFLSNTVNPAVTVGQFPILTAFCLLVSLLAQSRGRSILAGAALALATVKVGTTVPFLLLFTRKSDRRTWISLASFVMLLCLTQSTPQLLPEQLTAELNYIQEIGGEGKVNDFTPINPNFHGIIGFDVLFYWLGMNDRSMIRILEKTLVLSLTIFVAFQVVGRGRVSRGASIALVSMLSVLFLYHRNYDLVLIALPLTYAVGKVFDSHPVAGRRWYTAASCLMLLGMFQYGTVVDKVIAWTRHAGAVGDIICAVVVPAGTWLILLAMASLFIAARRDRRSMRREISTPTGTDLAG